MAITKSTTKGTSNKKTKTASAVKEKVKAATFTLQWSGKDVTFDQIRSNVIGASGKEEKDIKSLDIYVKPEDNQAYYVINGTDTGSIEI